MLLSLIVECEAEAKEVGSVQNEVPKKGASQSRAKILIFGSLIFRVVLVLRRIAFYCVGFSNRIRLIAHFLFHFVSFMGFGLSGQAHTLTQSNKPTDVDDEYTFRSVHREFITFTPFRSKKSERKSHTNNDEFISFLRLSPSDVVVIVVALAAFSFHLRSLCNI